MKSLQIKEECQQPFISDLSHQERDNVSGTPACDNWMRTVQLHCSASRSLTGTLQLQGPEPEQNPTGNQNRTLT